MGRGPRPSRGAAARAAAQQQTLPAFPWAVRKAGGQDDAEAVIRRMYTAINERRPLDAAECVDPSCLYEDLNFPAPFEGKERIRELFVESAAAIPDDLIFVIDECTSGDPLQVGLTWHLELAGQLFPNSRGCSFYRIDPESRKLVYARDIVENPTKLGDAAFAIIRAVLPLVRLQLGATAPAAPDDGEDGEEEPAAADGAARAACWALSAVYWYVLLLSPSGQLLPGGPMYDVAPDTLEDVVGESTNFFFILPALNAVGIDFMQAPVLNPVSEGFFNFCEAYIFMLLPLLLLDRRGRDLNTAGFWGGEMFLTNAILAPYMALRFGQAPTEPLPESKGALARPFGAVGLGVGALSLYWAAAARPEVGGSLSDRWAYWQHLLADDRVTIAFVVDVALFAVWQAFLMGEVMPEGDSARPLRWVPFFGLGAWLVL